MPESELRKRKPKNQKENENQKKHKEEQETDHHQPSTARLLTFLVLFALFLISVVLLFGTLYFELYTIGLSPKEPPRKPGGQMVDIALHPNLISRLKNKNIIPLNGDATFQMYIYCTGKHSKQNEKNITIILDSMAGVTSNQWHLLQQRLAKVSRVCVYDRAGLGFSEKSAVPIEEHTVAVMAEELRQLLERSNETKPYYFVGHSLGALVLRTFALMYPKDVEALMMIDVMDDKIFEDKTWVDFWDGRTFGLYPYMYGRPLIRAPRLAFEFGVLDIPGAYSAEYGAFVYAQEVYFLTLEKHWKAVYYEHANYQKSASEFRELWKQYKFSPDIIVRQITTLYYVYDPTKEPVNDVWRRSHTRVGLRHRNGIRQIMDDTLHDHFYPFTDTKQVFKDVFNVYKALAQPRRFKLVNKPVNPKLIEQMMEIKHNTITLAPEENLD